MLTIVNRGRCTRAVLAGVAGLLAFAGVASGAPVAPGMVIPTPGEPEPILGATLIDVTHPFVSVPAGFTGTLRTRVIAGDTTNILGGLTFVYEITNNAGSTHNINRLTVPGFGAFLTDGSYSTLGPGTIPFLVDRSTEGGPFGNVFGYTFLGSPIPAGGISRMLVVQTNSPVFNPTIASVINGSTANVESWAPIAIPAPGALALLASGVLVAGRRRR